MPFYTYVRVGSHIRTCRPTHTAAQAHTYVRVNNASAQSYLRHKTVQKKPACIHPVSILACFYYK